MDAEAASDASLYLKRKEALKYDLLRFLALLPVLRVRIIRDEQSDVVYVRTVLLIVTISARIVAAHFRCTCAAHKELLAPRTDDRVDFLAGLVQERTLITFRTVLIRIVAKNPITFNHRYDLMRL